MKTLFMVCMLLLSTLSLACDEIKVGYWWYCEPEPEESESPERAPLPAPPPQAKLMEMHPDDLSVMQEDYLKEAVWQTTPENVRNYYQVLDVVRRKSLAFMNVTNLVMLKNPELNAYAQYTRSNNGRKTLNKHKSAQLRAALSHYKNEYGLILFTRQTCIFCQTQYATLGSYSDRHGWPVKTIDIDRNPLAASRFNVTSVPLTIIVKKGADEWMPVAVGEEALTTIEINVYRAIRFLKGDTNPSQFLQMAHEDGSISDPGRFLENGL